MYLLFTSILYFRTGISAQSFSELKEDLEFKEEEFDKAKYTTEVIEMRNENLKKQLDDVRFS
jgi:hypothetical protein